MQASHQAKLLACEKVLEENRAREHMRSVPEAEGQLEDSKRADETSQYEEAIRLRDQSRATNENDVKKRIAAVNQKFEKDRDHLFAMFGPEIEALSKRFVEELQQRKLKKAAAIAKEDQNRDAQLAAMLQKAQGKLAQAGVKDQVKLLEADLEGILREKGLRMLSVVKFSAPPSEKKGTSMKSKRSKALPGLSKPN
jgi:hypothetical protein